MLKELDGKDLLEEVVQVCPRPVKELMTGLVGTLDGELTQVRYMEIGPEKWWLHNIWRCPKLFQLLKGESLSSPYVMTGASINLTNLPIYSRLSNISPKSSNILLTFCLMRKFSRFFFIFRVRLTENVKCGSM